MRDNLKMEFLMDMADINILMEIYIKENILMGKKILELLSIQMEENMKAFLKMKNIMVKEF